MSKVLVIDDDLELSASIKEILSRSGIIADVANCTDEADDMILGFAYDVIVLDWMMPGMTGIDYLQQLRSRGMQAPILMLTGMDSIDHKTRGLDTGADDYLTKPFHRNELLSRVRALMRRPRVLEKPELEAASVKIDTKNCRVTWHGQELKLTKQEYQLLELLMRHKNEIISQEALVERAWSSLSESSVDTVRVHMSRLRKKFENGPSPCPLQTVHGRGYVFVAEGEQKT